MKILLVDDDEGVVQVLLSFLEAIPGSQIRVAAGGVEALHGIADWGGLDLLMTDVVMDPMNGFELRAGVEKLYPGVKTVFISGYDLTDYAEQTRGCRVLLKPFDEDSLRQAIGWAIPTSAAPEQAASAAPAAAAPEESAPAASRKAAPDVTPGEMLGNYKINRLLGQGKWGSVYEAEQASMKRLVALKVLAPALRLDDASREQFVADARAKAHVQQPLILAVYEAGESGPYCYYALEYVDGLNLAEYAQRNLSIDDPLALQLIRVAAEGLQYLDQNRIPHEPLDAAHLYVDANRRPRLANTATLHESFPNPQQEIFSMAQIVGKALPGGKATDPALRGLLQRMTVTGGGGYPGWPMLLRSVKALEPKVNPAGAYKISARDVEAIHATDGTSKSKKRNSLIARAIVISSLFIALVVAWALFSPGNERDLESQADVPAGEFIYQDGQKVNLPEFSIDQYEVTLGQYSRFLKYLEKHPDEAAKFEHPDQPKGKSHKPKNWDASYGAASAFLPTSRKLNSVPIDLNCPVFGVDWWDAYAYAKWKGRRLPTEQEWEKAARGTDGRAYPWGNEFDPKLCNSAIDYNADPHAGGNVDGYNRWSPVDALKGDCSPYKVYGMAGNLSEWTDSWDPPGKFPVIRGGSYYSVDNTGGPDVKVTRRLAELYPNESSEYLGFRTAASKP